MNFSITTALCLAAADVEALIQGRMIAAISRIFISSVPYFAICPIDSSATKSNALITAWASLDSCRIYSEIPELEKLSKVTIWDTNVLKEIVNERYKIFVACLRVYHLEQSVEISACCLTRSRIGSFIKLPSYLSVTSSSPVLSDRAFAERKRQLETLEPPLHPELEALHDTIAHLATTNPQAKALEQDLKTFLGWAEYSNSTTPEPDLLWISTISTIGNSSDGHTFEKLVRKGLLKLGFSGSGLDPTATGGAGGMDFYGELPYPIVGECKATKTETVSDGTPAQLLRIGKNHLGKEKYDRAVKLIVAAGELNSYAQRTAREHEMNVIRPETLQRLVELKTEHPGSINLLMLKDCLKNPPYGEESNDKVNRYIDQVRQQLKVRSHIVQLLRKKAPQELGVDYLWGAYDSLEHPKSLDKQSLHNILIELSSPLAGFLGRTHDDRFYFLRDLVLKELS